MSQSDKISEINQSFSLGEMVILFKVDASTIKDSSGSYVGILRFTPGPIGGSSVVFDGETYTPVPVESSGFEWNGKGAFPQPRLKISNVNLAVTAQIKFSRGKGL